MIELIDIINASKGRDKNGDPKSGISISEQLIDSINNVKVLKENVFTEPEINIILNGNFISFDLKFSSGSSVEMRVLWNCLEKFGKDLNHYIEEDESPVLNFTILPLEHSGKYFYTLLNPICWTLQPSMLGAPIDTVRLLFEKEALNVFQSDEINEKEIDAEIEKEEYEKKRLLKIEEQKIMEHEEYLEKLNKRFNSHK